MKVILHQTNHSVADFKGQLETLISTTEPGVHVFPELFLSGYPLLDLCLQKPFILEYLAAVDLLQIEWQKLKPKDCHLLFGGLDYTLNSEGFPEKIKNVIYHATPEGKISAIYAKRLLPNYDIFDEQKYYSAGTEEGILNINGKNLGLLICEDMWVSSVHSVDPVKCLFDKTKNEKIQLDAIINLSASPFFLAKDKVRHERASFISNQFGCPFFYVNKVGGEDEVIFDGQSFVMAGKELIKTGKKFESDTLTLHLSEIKASYAESKQWSVENTWESLFNPRLEIKKPRPVLKKWSEEESEEAFLALSFGLKEYARKNGFKKFTIALSGGIDSALVLSLATLTFGENAVEAIYMPSQYSSPLSYDLSYQLCQNLKVKLTSLPIKFLHSSVKNQFTTTFNDLFSGLTDENVQSRLRGLLLYTRSNQAGSMVINTSNKSEIAVGYSTQYGDSVGALSLLGDLYKGQVYQLAQFINKKFNKPIPVEIITRAPSAELRPNQKDQDSLPDYEILDALLEGILSYRLDAAQLEHLGFDPKEVERTLKLYSSSEYKRKQFPPILKISSKSFGFGYRVPISKVSDFYHLKLSQGVAHAKK